MVRLTPKGGRDAIEGVVVDENDRPLLSVRVSAAPVDGAANKSLIKLLAKALGARKSEVVIASGETSRVKRLRIAGDYDAMAARLVAFQ
jgi:uncharacterized protein (TIGR00251 family)